MSSRGESQSIGFLGAGNMAGALLRGLLAAGYPPAQLFALDLEREKLRPLEEQGVVAVQSLEELCARATVVVLATKPGALPTALSSAPQNSAGHLWLSIAAGITTARLEELLGQQARVIRAMPNTPALVGAGATAFCAGSCASSEDRALAQRLLSAAGYVAEVDESLMDAVTGLSGSGPAYVMLMIEALADGGVRAGLPRPIAQTLAAQTLLGSAQLLLSTGQHPGQLKDAVASPGGTTIAGLEALETAGLRGALMQAVAAATERSRALGQAKKG